NAVRALRADPADATLLRKIANRPQGTWFVGGTPAQVQAGVHRAVTAARAAGRIPVLVAYDLPKRDCGSYSAGGAADAHAYQLWSSAFLAGLGQLHAVVVLEPDALMQLGCLSPHDQVVQVALVKRFVLLLKHDARAVTYIDAGKAGAQPAATMHSRLLAAGVGYARGFSLNVSGFDWTSSEIAYGHAIGKGLGVHARFVVDTGRNGRGPYGSAWCNPPGRGLGLPPTSSTGVPGVDAYLWVKPPGASDGACTPGAPAAGAWWNDYALGLARRSLTP
ncbi:MAG: glycoside hydrolase family 6 protein, partial [Mycobacteriales bacterium]